MLALEDYRQAVQLDQPMTTINSQELLDAKKQHRLTLKLLSDFSGSATAEYLRTAPDKARRALYALMIQARPFQFSNAELAKVDILLASESHNRSPHQIQKRTDQERRTQLKLWRGDITTLACDAIVNAANSELLGCFRPDHPCIDNAIHAKAGPRLRDDCARIMQLQGYREATGEAKITRGYHLPASFVLHTVGPIHKGDDRLGIESKMLARSYTSCLKLASQISAIKSLAFCCISTGIFGFPAAVATQIAIETVTKWTNTYPDRFNTIVFNVFCERDQYLYEQALGSYHHA
mgnify:FL=1